jgi:hypothetical protein
MDVLVAETLFGEGVVPFAVETITDPDELEELELDVFEFDATCGRDEPTDPA